MQQGSWFGNQGELRSVCVALIVSGLAGAERCGWHTAWAKNKHKNLN